METTAGAHRTQQVYSTLQLPDPSTDAQHSATPVAERTMQASAISTLQSVSQLNSFSTADEVRAVSGARRRRSSAGGQRAHHLFSRFAWSGTPEVVLSELGNIMV